MTDTRPEKRSLFLFPFTVIIYTEQIPMQENHHAYS